MKSKRTKALENPLNILESSTVDDSIVVVTKLTDKEGRIVIVSMAIDGKGNVEFTDVNNKNEVRRINANVVTSAYGRNNYDSWMEQNKDKMIYDIDDGIIKKRIDGKWLQLPSGINSTMDNSTTNDSKSQMIVLPTNSNMQKNKNNTTLSRAEQQELDTLINLPFDLDTEQENRINYLQNKRGDGKNHR